MTCRSYDLSKKQRKNTYKWGWILFVEACLIHYLCIVLVITFFQVFINIFFCLMHHINRQYTGFFLTALFVFYFVSISFFYHTHYDENHQLIVHSHPFSSESNHHHSQANFYTIDRLSSLFTNLLLMGIFLIAILVLRAVFFNPYRKEFRFNAFTPFCFSRPPPAF